MAVNINQLLAWLDNKRKVVANNMVDMGTNPIDSLNQTLYNAVETNLPSRREMGDARSVMPGMGDDAHAKLLGLAMMPGVTVRGYHGTNAAFDTFSDAFQGAGQGVVQQVPGIWFTTEKAIAPYFGKRVIDAELSVTKPYEMKAATYMQKFMYNGEDPVAFRERLIKRGYDGLRIKAHPEYEGGHGPSGTEEWGFDNWVAFHPDQIKIQGK